MRPKSLATLQGLDQRSKMKEIHTKFSHLIEVVQPPPLLREIDKNSVTNSLWFDHLAPPICLELN